MSSSSEQHMQKSGRLLLLHGKEEEEAEAEGRRAGECAVVGKARGREGRGV